WGSRRRASPGRPGSAGCPAIPSRRSRSTGAGHPASCTGARAGIRAPRRARECAPGGAAGRIPRRSRMRRHARRRGHPGRPSSWRRRYWPGASPSREDRARGQATLMSMAGPKEKTSAAAPGALVRSILGNMRLAYLPVLVTYFCYGASGITGIALLYFQKDALAITPAEAAGIAFWVALPWSTKMVAGGASHVYPIFGSRRVSYMLLGALLSFAGYAWLATTASSKPTYLAAMVLVPVGFTLHER